MNFKQKIIIESELIADTSKVLSYVEVMGNKIEIPVIYSDSKAYMALFSVSKKKAYDLINTDKVHPISIFKERVVFAITIFDYKNCPVGPYREIALSFPVVIGSSGVFNLLAAFKDYFQGNLCFYTLMLGMNTRISREHSNKIFGYPVHDSNLNIDLLEKEINTEIEVSEQKQKIVSLNFDTFKKQKIDTSKYKTLFYNKGVLRCVNLSAVSFLSSKFFDSNGISIGDHSISEILRNLEINPKPFASLVYEDLLEILEAPFEVELNKTEK